MKPPPFDYYAPATLEEALDLLARYGDEAKALAGGQSLVPAMNFRLAQPAVLVDLNRLDELAGIRLSERGGMLVGAMTRQRALERSELVGRWAPLVAEAMPHVAHPQIRNRGTLGGSLAHADPAAELPAIAVALGMKLRARHAAGERVIPAEAFFLGLFATALEPDELLVEVEIPPLPPRSGSAFEEVARRHGDYAMAGAAAVVTLDEAGAIERSRLLFFSVGDAPVEAASATSLLRGERPTTELIEAAAEAAATGDVDPVGDIHASAAYRRHLVRVLARRTLVVATSRAQALVEV